MSYIINKTSPFISIKLTEKGRETLAKGQLNFKYWSIGDSEINYNREEVFEENQNDSTLSQPTKILKPIDNQPDFTSKIYGVTNVDGYNTLKESEINTLKLTVDNKAKGRGFFTPDTLQTLSGSTHTTAHGTIQANTLNGSDKLIITPDTKISVGDLVMIKATNTASGDITLVSNDKLIPTLWYKIKTIGTTTVLNDTLTLDRNLINYSTQTGNINYIIYKGGEIENGFGYADTTQYWNSNTLSFEGNCQISAKDHPIWNMSNVWCENLIGMNNTAIEVAGSNVNEDYNKFGSNSFIGQKYPFLNYDCASDNDTLITDNCGLPGQSVIDGTRKSLSILHYTNNTISNFYGEFFHIETGKELVLDIPNIMYHRRNEATASGTTMGMRFKSGLIEKELGLNKVIYHDLIEDSTMVSKPRVVGKVFPKHKIVIFDDDEIVAAMSYKSNRNWTLPELSSTLVPSEAGVSGGTLDVGKTMYMTYSLDSEDGLGHSLPCQYFTKVTNNTASSKDVTFRINDIDELPFMRKVEKAGYDGLGFNAKNFKILYQIVAKNTDRPDPAKWLEHDFTSTSITTNTNETIDPLALIKQNEPTFLITKAITTSAPFYNLIDKLNMAKIVSPDDLQFGDERFFYGNLNTYIGATIFKTIFNLNISGDSFVNTTNKTRSNAEENKPDIKVSEVGIYDSNKNLVMVGKLSKPSKLTSGNTIMIELGMDF